MPVLQRLGLEPSQVSGILITHEHGDHACGAFEFAAAHRVTVYLTHGTAAALKAEGKLLDGVPVCIVNGRQAFFIDGLQLVPFTVPHDAREPLQLTCTDGAARLGILTDAGCATAHLVEQLQGCQALLLECNHDAGLLQASRYPPSLKARIAGRLGHLGNHVAADILAACTHGALKHVVAAHLSEQNNTPQLAVAALSGVLGCGPDDVIVATPHGGFGWLAV